MFWPCETRTSTCRNLATISSGLYRFLAITVLLDVRDIPQVGPLQWGWISDLKISFPTFEKFLHFFRMDMALRAFLGWKSHKFGVGETVYVLRAISRNVPGGAY